MQGAEKFATLSNLEVARIAIFLQRRRGVNLRSTPHQRVPFLSDSEDGGGIGRLCKKAD